MGATGDALGSLGLDVKPFQDALAVVDAEMADLLIESQKLNAEIKLLERNMFAAGGGTKAQAKELKELTAVSEDFTEQIKRAKEEQKAFGAVTKTTETETTKLSQGFKGLFASFAGFSVLHSVISGFIQATDAAIKLREEIDKITTGNLSSGFISTSELQKQISEIDSLKEKIKDTKSVLEQGIEDHLPSLHKLLYSGAEDDRKQQTDELDRKRVQIDAELAEKQSKRNALQREEIDGENEITRLKKSQLEFDEKIGKAAEEHLPQLVAQLKIEKDIAAEAIKTAEAKKRAAVTSYIANDEAKQAIDNVLNDQKNKDAVDDAQADKDAARVEKDRQDEINSDFKSAEERKKSLQKEVEDGNKLYLAQETKNKKIKELAKQHAQTNFDAGITTAVGDLSQSGHSLDAQEIAIRQQYAQKKRQAYDDLNPDLVDELNKQEQQALRHNRASQAEQTVRSRISERDASRREARDSSRQDSRDAEFQRRIDRGEHGDRDADGNPISPIEAYRDKQKLKGKLDANVDKARTDPNKHQGFTSQDSEYLKQCAEALKPKT